MRVMIIAFVILAYSAMPCTSGTIRVDWSGGGDYLTIQEGIDAAVDGDTVLVAAGVYTGDNNVAISFGVFNIVLMSELGAEQTVVDGDGSARAFRIMSGVDTTTVIQGFTLRNCYGNDNGGAMRLIQSSPTIKDCIFHDNTVFYNGAAIHLFESTSLIKNCTFYNNAAPWRGGGIMLELAGATARIVDCTFYNNSAVLTGGGAVYSNAAAFLAKGCTFIRNDAPVGGAIAMWPGAALPTIANCVIAFSTDGNGIDGGTNTTHCVIFGNADGDSLQGTYHDNLFIDPLLCDIDAADFTLCANSPCLPGNNSWSEPVGAYGQGCADCDAPVEAVAWSKLKSMFR